MTDTPTPPAGGRFRKRPIEVDAIDMRRAYHYAQFDWSNLPDWLVDAYEDGRILFLTGPARAEIRTLEGTMTAGIDDWIIRGVKDELYPCKPDVFAATYEPAGGAS